MFALKIIALILVGLVILMAFTGAVGNFFMKKMAAAEARQIFETAELNEIQTVSAQMLDSLPQPMRKYLQFTGIVGEPVIHTVRLKQSGKFRGDARQNFFELCAEQYFTTERPAFIWLGKISTLPLVSVQARDKYAAGAGNMLIKLLSVFTIDDVKGAEMDRASLLRYFSEMIWFPTAYLDPRIRFTEIDSLNLQAEFTDGDLQVGGKLTFDENGAMVRFEAERFNSTENKMLVWRAHIDEYGELNGIKIPVRAHTSWVSDGVESDYILLNIDEVQYNISEPY